MKAETAGRAEQEVAFFTVLPPSERLISEACIGDPMLYVYSG